MDLALAAVVPDIVAGSMVKAMLEQADIPVMLRSSGSTNWLIPGTPGGAGPLDVMVPEERLAEARELIGELEGGGGVADPESEVADPRSEVADAESGLAEPGGDEPEGDGALS